MRQSLKGSFAGRRAPLATTAAFICLVSATVSAQPSLPLSEVAAVLDGKYALNEDTYKAYQRCLDNIPIGGPYKDIAAGKSKCKAAAVARSYPAATIKR